MNKPFIILVFLIFITFSSCEKEQDPFQISTQHIGLLTDSTQVKDLEAIYANDSISRYIGGDEFTGNINDIEIYDKTVIDEFLIFTF